MTKLTTEEFIKKARGVHGISMIMQRLTTLIKGLK